MTTLNAAYTRRAIGRIAAPEAGRRALPRARWTGLRALLPAPADSRGTRAVLSVGARPAWPALLELAGLVAAAVGLVALLATLCR